MASEERAAASPLINELLQAPRRFSFYQIVRLLERSRPETAPLGGHGPVEQEAVRLRPNPSMGFASADVQEVAHIEPPEAAGGGPWPAYRVTVNFLGLYGAGSPLPAFYTEDIVMRDEEGETRRAFFDFFHHRYLSFLYRAWEKYRYDQRYHRGASDQQSQWIRGLIGLRGAGKDGTGKDGADLPVEHPERLLSSIGLLLLHSRSAATLEKILSHYFEGLPVRIEQFIAREVRIEESQRTYLGRANATLGVDCTPGETVPDISGKFRLEIGPLDFASFRDLLPDGEGFRKLQKLVPYLLRDQLAYDIELSLREAEVPALDLGAECPARLGWSSWLGEPPGGDGRVVLAP